MHPITLIFIPAVDDQYEIVSLLKIKSVLKKFVVSFPVVFFVTQKLTQRT